MPNSADIMQANVLFELRALCDRELSDAVRRFSEVTLAIVSTADARAVSCKFSRPGEPNRLAAMVSSLIALCESFSSELEAGVCHTVDIIMDDCVCVVVRVKTAKRSLVLAVVVEKGVMLAVARRIALNLSEKIGLLVSRSMQGAGL